MKTETKLLHEQLWANDLKAEYERVKAERDELAGNLEAAANAYDDMKTQRDELAAALTRMTSHKPNIDRCDYCDCRDGSHWVHCAYEAARTALAKLEAKK